jgi:hypothetical protein
MRGTRRLVGVLLVGAAAFAWLPSARAQQAGNTLVVSTPAGGLTGSPGYPLHTWIRVGNNGDRPLEAIVSVASLSFGDNGEVRLGDEPDATWGPRVHIASPDLSLAPHTYSDEPIDVALPETLAPDTYFVGFLVTPVPTAGNVRVINRIGTFIAFDVAGERQRSVKIEELRVPHFVFGTHVPIKFTVRNTGPSFATTWSELHVGSWRAADRLHPFAQRERVPSGHSRDYVWTSRMPFTFGFVHVQALAFFNKTDQQIAQSQATAATFVIDPRFAVAALIAAALAAVWLRRRRPRPPRLRAVDVTRDVRNKPVERPAATAR